MVSFKKIIYFKKFKNQFVILKAPFHFKTVKHHVIYQFFIFKLIILVNKFFYKNLYNIFIKYNHIFKYSYIYISKPELVLL